MKKLIALMSILLLSMTAKADYAYGPFNTWTYVDTHNIIVQGAGKYLVQMQFCFIFPSSTIKILSNPLGPYIGKILVDDQVCDVTQVHRI